MTIGLTLPPPQTRKMSAASSDIRRDMTESFFRCFQNHYYGHRFVHANPHYIANVRLSINHWQIRDLLQIDQATGEVYHTVDEHIRVLSPQKQRGFQSQTESHNHVTLPYRPRCFNHAAGGLIVTGGVLTALLRAYLMEMRDLTQDFNGKTQKRHTKGLFSVYSLELAEEMSFQLGDMINNAVAVYPQQNSQTAYTAYACNNDLGLYTADISNSGVHGTRRIVCEDGTSLNNVQESPDGRTVTITGDSGTVFLVDPVLPLPVVQKIHTSHDAGFGISYHAHGTVLAAAFQDGTCAMYDVRYLAKPLHEIMSTRPGHLLGAFRTCRFLHLPVHDVLAVLEHLGRVHLVDMRDLSQESHQVVLFPYALDQYARFKAPAEETEDEYETDIHQEVGVYAEDAPFTAPLVYDYEYLTDGNSKLFKGFTYEPPQLMLASSVTTTQEPMKLQVNATTVEEYLPDASSAESELSPDNLPAGENMYLDAEAYNAYIRQSRQLYQQAVNHVNGEMEIAGIDWHDNRLYVGCEDGGILVWDVNSRARRSFGSYSYV